MSSFCAQCGAALKSDARFCEECGVQVYGKAPSVIAPPKRVLLLGGLSIVVILGIGALLFLTNGLLNLTEQKGSGASLTRLSKSQEEARRELVGQLGIQYTLQAFVGAAKNGDILPVQLFLAAGMDPNVRYKDETALMGAADNGHTAVVETLLTKGADVNAKDIDGHTALTHATLGGRTEIVQLLKAGARE